MKSVTSGEDIMLLPYCFQQKTSQVHATGRQADGYYLVDTINVYTFLWTDHKQTIKTLFNFVNVLQSPPLGKKVCPWFYQKYLHVTCFLHSGQL